MEREDAGSSLERTTQHIITRRELWSKVDVTHSATSAWRESEFETWLRTKLATDREEMVTRLQERVSQHLTDYKKDLLHEVEGRIGCAFATASPPGRGSVGLESAIPPTRGSLDAANWQGVGSVGMASVGSRRKGSIVLSARPRASMSEGTGSVPPGDVVQNQDRWPELGDPPADDGPQAMRTNSQVSRGGNQYKSDRLKALYSAKSSEALHAENRFSCGKWLKRIVKSTAFEIVCCVLILVNTLVMATEVQYVGCKVADAIDHPDCPDGAAEAWPGAADVFTAITVSFTGIFIVEFLLRLVVMGKAAVTSGWMWLDFVLIALGCIDALERLAGSLTLPINPAMMRTARIARMVRMLKVIKTRESFATLFLLLKSITASTHALVWSVLLLLFTMSCVGMLMNQLIYGYLTDDTLTFEDRREVFDYYGTYTRMMITMFELTLGNWAPPSRLLMDKIGEGWGLFIVIYRCVFCFALVNVTAAVFITETNRVAASDDEVMMMRKERANRSNAKKLEDVFKELDDSGDGVVTWDEFEQVLEDNVMKQFLATLDLEVGDLQELFKLLDDGDGHVDCEEFIQGINTLRGQAKNIDLLTLLKLTRNMNGKLEHIEKKLAYFAVTERGRGGAPKSSPSSP